MNRSTNQIAENSLFSSEIILKCHRRRKCYIKEENVKNVIQVENATPGLKMQHQGRKCNIKWENVIMIKKHEKRSFQYFSNSEISVTNMDGLKLKITMVIFTVAGPPVLIILNRYLLLIRRYHKHHNIGFWLDHQNSHDWIK